MSDNNIISVYDRDAGNVSCQILKRINFPIHEIGYYCGLQGNKGQDSGSDSQAKTVVVTSGGTWMDDSSDFYKSVIEAYKSIAVGDPLLFRSWKILAPSDGLEEIKKIASEIIGEDFASKLEIIENLKSDEFEDLVSYGTSKLIMRAGYSLPEVVAKKVEAVVIPRSRTVVDEEQVIRAKAFAKAKKCVYVENDEDVVGNIVRALSFKEYDFSVPILSNAANSVLDFMNSQLTKQRG